MPLDQPVIFLAKSILLEPLLAFLDLLPLPCQLLWRQAHIGMPLGFFCGRLPFSRTPETRYPRSSVSDIERFIPLMPAERTHECTTEPVLGIELDSIPEIDSEIQCSYLFHAVGRRLELRTVSPVT